MTVCFRTSGSALRRPDAVEEVRDLGFEVLRPRRQPCGPAADFTDRGRGLVGGLLDRLDLDRGARGIARCGLDAVGDFARRRTLLADRSRNRGRYRSQLMDDAADRAD